MLHRSAFRILLSAALLAGAAAGARAQQADERYDLLIAGGTVVDGTGAPGRLLDVGIRGDRIVALGPSLPRSRAARVLDAAGRAVAPGFIDVRAELQPLLRLGAESVLRQGVTLAVGGQGGSSPLRLGAYFDSLRAAGIGINAAFLVGHNDVRLAVLGLAARAPDAAELARMQALVAAAMGQGAFGLSTRLAELPGEYASLFELVALARVAADSGGIYSTQLRDEGAGLVAGVAEALEIGRQARVPVLLGSHQALGPAAWGRSSVALALVDSARRAGTDVVLDRYPYASTLTGIDALMPEWALAGGRDAFRKRLADPVLADSMVAGLVTNILAQRGGSDLDRMQFTGVSWDTRTSGKTLTELAECRNLEPIPENGARVLLDAVLSDSGAAAYYVLDEQDVLPLETAVHTVTQLPAKHLGLADRGVLRVGAYADVVVFDPQTVSDRATFTEPDRYPVGIETVVVNGEVAVEGGRLTAVRAGRVLTRPRGSRQVTATPPARSANPGAGR